MGKKHKKEKQKKGAKIVSLMERFGFKSSKSETKSSKSDTKTVTYTYTTSSNWLSESNMITLVEKMGFLYIKDKDVKKVMKMFPDATKIEIINALEQVEQYRIDNPPIKENPKCQSLLPAPETVTK